MFCGKIKLENDKIRIANENENLNSEHAIPVFLSNIIENLEVPDMHNTIELCNVHYIEVEDFEKDSDTPKKPDEYLASLLRTEDHLFKDNNKGVLPTLHLSAVDFFKTDISFSTGVAIPRCIKYIDSSIWHYYVPSYLDETDSNQEIWLENMKSRLSEVINTIIDNTKMGLYYLSVTQEQADFYARIIRQSYLVDIGAHKKKISPFIFHSEREMKEAMKKLLKKEKEISPYMPVITGMGNSEKHPKAQWRLLLVDDYAKKKMKTYPLGNKSLCKEEIVDKILGSMFEDKECYVIESVDTVKEAIERLKKRRYDIILLDYLLNYKEGGQREYGFELLQAIEEGDKQLQENKGPFGKYWIFPITSFDEAFSQKIREQGWGYNSKHWILAQGACPLDTPESFKYHFFKFINGQLEGLEIKLKDCGGSDIYTLKQFLIAIFDDETLVRSRAIKNFNALYLLKANYNKLKDDIKPQSHLNSDEKKIMSSLLVKSIYEDINDYDSEFWGHILFMMYITAYPPSNQWYRLSHEFLAIKSKLEKGQDKSVSDKIVKYINCIKSI